MTPHPMRQCPPKAIRHFHHLDAAEHHRLFFLAPEELPADADRDLLAVALGATLYMPADSADLAATVARRAKGGVCSMVLALEDAVDDTAVDAAMDNSVAVLDELAESEQADGAMLFVRVRSPGCIKRLAESLSAGAAALTGYVLPKF